MEKNYCEKRQETFIFGGLGVLNIRDLTVLLEQLWTFENKAFYVKLFVVCGPLSNTVNPFSLKIKYDRNYIS